MTPLHLRKVIIVAKGIYESPEVMDGLARHGAEHLVANKVTYKVVFWVPLPPGHPKRKRDLARGTVVPDAIAHEIAALRDGAIEEVVLNVDLPADTPDVFRDRIMREAWERLARHRMGAVPVVAADPIIVSGEVAAREFKRRSLS